jgi:hypothetical protein
MEPRSTKVVAVFDVLGFESLLRSRGLDRMLQDYAKLTAIVDKMDGCMCIRPIPNGDGTFSPAVGYLATAQAYFSDTILLWSNYDAFKLPAFCQMCSDLFCESLELGLPMRGGIAVGDTHLDADSGVFVGLPLVEAARAESAQLWLGVSLSASFAVEPFNHNFDLRTVLAYRAHRKRGRKYAGLLPGMVLDWPRRWRENRKGDVRSLVTSMDSDPEFHRYYKHTLRFIDYSENHHDWFLRSGRIGLTPNTALEPTPTAP